MNPFTTWLAAAEQRYLADLTRAELGRALRALSSCYVERRGKLADGGALSSAGKRAAFGLFYAPLHFLTVREIARGLAGELRGERAVLDLGCGTGAAGAAWSLTFGGTVQGTDVNTWAVQEAEWTYRALGVGGHARRQPLERVQFPSRPATILAAYVVNELPLESRAALLPRLIAAAQAGHQVVVVEPVARKLTPWWPEWQATFEEIGGDAREWRFRTELPELLRQLDRATGLDHRELTARTLAVGK